MANPENQLMLETPSQRSGGDDDTMFDEESHLLGSNSYLNTGGLYSRKLIFAVIISCLNTIQYGYHMSELNGPETIYSCQKSVAGPIGNYDESYFGRHGYLQCIPLNSRKIGIVTSIFSIGGLLGSIYAGLLADRYGRKLIFSINSIFFIVGSTIEATASSYAMISIGRLISGLGAGSGIVVTPIYINEISPLELTGTMGSMNQVSINLGILLAQSLAIWWANDEQWRIILLIGSIIALINFIGVLSIDESPKWLTINGHETAGFDSLMKLRSFDLERCKYEVDHWHKLKSHEERSHKSEHSIYQYLTSSVYENSRIVATVVMVGQQFCGINSITFYGVKVLTALFPKNSIIIVSMVSVVNTALTFAASFVLDRLGRKPMLLASVSIMMIASIGIGFGMIADLSILSVVSTFIYVGSFAIGLGPIPFLLIPEVTQNEVKGLAQSFGTTLNGLATFLVGFLFPIFNEQLGGGVYFLFAVVCFLFVAFTYYRIPETKGKNTYEEVWNI